MFRSLTIVFGAVVALIPRPLPAGQFTGGIALHTIRLYRAEANKTRIKAFIEIPYAMLRAGSERMAYRVGVKLSDSTGLTLLHQEWWGHAPAELQGSDASTVEILDFAVAPGIYRVHIAVTDSVSGRSAELASEVRGFEAAPPISDLWLAPRMRLVSESDTVPGLGELREGSTLITAAAQTVLTPLRSTLYYLVEAYTGIAQSGTMQVTVSDSAGKVVTSSKPVPLLVGKGGGILKGQMDLAGLPAGRYSMTLIVASATDTVSRSADFVMRGLEETLEKSVAERAAMRVTDEGYFAEMNSKQLDEAEAPLGYIAKDGELRRFDKDLSVNAKRRFLTDFWASRDPTPATPRNEARERFYDAITYANRHFTEGGRKPVPGWKSDRGRVYARYGEPDDKLERQQEGTAPPYQVWRYTRERNRYYVFADRVGFGTFVLLTTNDTKEAVQANWTDVLGRKAVEDVGRFLGIEFSAQ
jgi:GWxTD domain-containing protein